VTLTVIRQLDISSQNVLSIPEPPVTQRAPRARSNTVTLPAVSIPTPAQKIFDVLTPTTTSSNPEGMSPLHCAAIYNRRNSKGSQDAPSARLTSINLKLDQLYDPLQAMKGPLPLDACQDMRRPIKSSSE
jgi:hypothetical protein